MTTAWTAGFSRLLRRVVPVERGEIPALLWAAAQMFCLLAGNYVIRPVRESLGSQRGSVDLKQLYLYTFIATLIATMIWAALVARYPVKRFVTMAYEFFAFSFVAFWIMLQFGAGRLNSIYVGYAFFVWYSVYNIFIVSMFWSRAADLFTLGQGKRLFPFMAAGASLGAVAGSSVTTFMVDSLGTYNLLLVPAVLLQAALACSRRLSTSAVQARASEGTPEAARIQTSRLVRGSIVDGLKKLLASPLLGAVALYVLCASFCGTCVYNMQSDLARESFPDKNDRTEYFAKIDLSVNVLAFFSETLLTPRIIAWVGVGAALLALPAVYVLGFSVGSFSPVIAMVAALAIAQRSVAYGFTTPAREAVFTVVPRDDKYKAKNAIDTFVWRGGDVAAQWLIYLLIDRTVGDKAAPSTKAGIIAIAGIPVAILWMLGAWRLRRLHRAAVSAAP